MLDLMSGSDARRSILSGVKIGHGAVVGAGAVVVKDIPPYGVAVGIQREPYASVSTRSCRCIARAGVVGPSRHVGHAHGVNSK